MNIKAMDAANAYANTLKSQGVGGLGGKVEKISPVGSVETEGAGSFSSILKESLGSTAEAVGRSETTGIQALNKQADLVDVVTSVQNAEMVLETVVAVRDKVISAYQDIIRMPI
ncbi:flagellar hook-basal body complex protein FliE [Emcibacter sp.]|uniref:flagellar hook-basal body complex protein FliE n=1 Tax=Emcibacter sp. TaxID=1979954 RepID=UPI002AA93544|nr:flagellar hook-basal body complex protein FliE [Emcibacter sp.]